MKSVLVVALVVVVLLTGIPVVMGMPAMVCADCDIGLLVGGVCVLAVLAALVGAALVSFSLQLRMRALVFASLLTGSRLDRPPRLA